MTSFVPGSIDNSVGTVLFNGNPCSGRAAAPRVTACCCACKSRPWPKDEATWHFDKVVLLDSALAPLDATPIDGRVRVSAVPEFAPRSWPASGPAALAANLQGQRRRTASTAASS